MSNAQDLGPYCAIDAGEAKFGRKAFTLDIQRFAADLATKIGGECLKDEAEMGSTYASIRVGEVILNISRAHGAGKGAHVVISGSAPRFGLSYREWPSDAKFPEGSFLTSRPLEKLAADIRRRVVEPSAAPLAKIKARAAEIQDARKSLEGHVAALTAKFPTVNITMGDRDSREASFYLNNKGAYLSGRLTSTGALYVDRCGTIEADRLAAVLTALTAPTA